ncbi:hypothetical protein [Novilysobacter antarcticus]|uniref:hypothetical protein n=1 Tax=Novilysobacter antarcticus TaxID=2862543 RepID=UPI001C990EB2|nr:hypothetical protein [Lysobacter antarcticus]
MEALLAIVQLLLVPVLLGVALTIRFAGTSTPLNGVDYGRVTDPSALHRWAGNRLLVLPLGYAMSGVASLLQPSLALLAFMAMVLVVLGVAIWVTLGAESFHASL